jgi:hypothetical protein
LNPLNVWEFNADGTTFERSYVVDQITDWVNRINGVYSDVEEWSVGRGIFFDRSRTVRMAEELMQKFSVPDRELPILDLSMDSSPLLSFVPFGLWIIGSYGRIDIISKHGTSVLVDASRPPKLPEWRILVSRTAREFVAWNKDSFVELCKAAEAT